LILGRLPGARGTVRHELTQALREVAILHSFDFERVFVRALVSGDYHFGHGVLASGHSSPACADPAVEEIEYVRVRAVEPGHESGNVDWMGEIVEFPVYVSSKNGIR
jgi:hypothetical protein